MVAKLESRQSLFNFQSILQEADGLIISRGNLGLDIVPEKMAHVSHTPCTLGLAPLAASIWSGGLNLGWLHMMHHACLEAALLPARTLPACLPARPSARLPACALPACLHTACLPACLLARPRARLPACLQPTCRTFACLWCGI